MSEVLFKRLERFRERHNLSILALCRQLETSHVNYHRWKKAQKITGPYRKIVEDFLNKHDACQPHLPATATSDIAVIGIACNYPGANNVKELWENILAKRVQFRRIPDARLPLKDYYAEDPTAPDKIYLTKAALIDGFAFNWSKLRIPKKTFESTDIVHWLALDTALQAFADAGYALNGIPCPNTGVIVGNTLTGEQTRSQTLRLRWPYVQKALNATLANLGVNEGDRARISGEMEKAFKSAFYPITEDSLAGGLANTIAGRICNYLNLKGGGYIVDGACSSSLLAVATAANALKSGEMDLVLAGGVDVSLDPFELVGFSKAGALAKDQMRVYDQRANGFIPGEGCGFVVLKRLEDARREKDYVYAVIKGWGISSDGKGGIMEPSASGQAAAIQRAYKNSGYKVAEVDFIEGHGTGTTKGDRVEIEGIASAREGAPDNEAKRWCGITSFKSIVGHTKAAAGIGGLIKAVLAVNQRILPPTANCQEPNEVFREKARHLYPLIRGESLAPAKIVRAGISSAGFGGINCHVTIESRDEPSGKIQPSLAVSSLLVSSQATEIFVFASPTAAHLRNIIHKFKEDLRNISVAEMADLAARLNKKAKKRPPVKIAVVTDSPEHLYEALNLIEREIEAANLAAGQIRGIKAGDPGTHIVLSNKAAKARLGFLYPGQGAQRLNMARRLVERFEWARGLLAFSKVPLYDYIYKAADKFPTQEEQEGFNKQLAETQVTQPAVIFSSLVWSGFLLRLGIEPCAVGGHSLGELTAFYKAGAFSEEKLMEFAELRGSLMAASGDLSGSMVSLFCPLDTARELVDKVGGDIFIANINGPAQIVVSGGNSEIEQVIVLANKEKITAHRLNVSNAFHSPFMKGVAESLKSAILLQGVFKPNLTGLYSCTDGRQITEAVALGKYFADQAVSPVNFQRLVESISKDCDVLIEVGPGRVLTDLAKAINGNNGPLCLPVESTADNDRDLNVVLAELFVRNAPIRWEELYKGRLIRPFVPASRKRFIENQCERPLKLIERSPEVAALAIEPKAGAVDMIKESLAPEGAQEKIADESGEGIANLLIELANKMTGFDKSSLSLNLRLLDDLNLDSIKAAELIAEATKALGLAGQIDPSQYSNKTLEEIRQKLDELLGEKRAGKPRPVTQQDILRRYARDVWVRNFTQRFEPEPITARDPNALSSIKNVLVVSDIKPREVAERLKDNLKDVRVDDASPDCMVVLLPGSGEAGMTPEKLHAAMERLHEVIAPAADAKQVVFAQLGTGDFTSGHIRSLASTLHLERPDLRLRIIDFHQELSDQFIADKILDELQTTANFCIAGYTAKGARQVPVFAVSDPAAYGKRGIRWTKDDVALATGGAKGITAECALEFARATRARMVLVGRSAKDKEIVATLERFRKENLYCDYRQCDVTDPGQVQRIVGYINQQVGPVTAVIHGAGLNSLRRLKPAKLADAYKESLPKILGAVNILDALKDQPLKLFVAMTSIIGVTGMEGSGWYGFANEALLQYLRSFQGAHPATEIIAPAFGVWDEVGMGVKLGSIEKLAERGVAAIPVAEGVRRFRELIERNPGTEQVIVAGRVAGLDTLKFKEFKPSRRWRFIEDVKYWLPGVELVNHVRLNIQDDSYVLDHNWKGSLLFPLVFGLEAMAEAACFLTENQDVQGFRFRDVKLERAIAVSEQSGTIIEIHALAVEGAGTKKVKVEIFCEQTNFKEPHFSAIVELNPSLKPAGRTVPPGKLKKGIELDLKTDIYGPILFQGGEFQRLRRIHELYYDEKKKAGACVFQAEYGKPKTHLLVGDPYFIDTAFQSMQVIASQDLCLPYFIKEINVSALRRIKQSECFVESQLLRTDQESYLGNASANERNVSILVIRNCRLKIIKHLPENPSANDIVNPSPRDQRILEETVSKIARALNAQVPVIKCLYDLRLKKCSKSVRHDMEAPLIQDTIAQAFLNRRGKAVREIKIKWLESGRPVVINKVLKDLNISLSHEGGLLVCVADYGQQGCDIETIKDRTEKDWLALLGRKHYLLLEKMLNLGVDLNTGGTAIWGAIEAFKKSLTTQMIDMQLSDYYENCFVFEGSSYNTNIKAVSIPIKLTYGREKALSLLINQEAQKRISNPKQGRTEVDKVVLKNFGFNEELLFGVNLDYSGPRRQIVFTQRFPVTFKSNQLSSRGVYFTNFFDWMGTIREYSAYPIFKYFLSYSKTGKGAMVTNMTRLNILGTINSGDIVEGRIWMDDIMGDKNATLNLFYEWRRLKDNEQYERVALGQQNTSWVNIMDNGVVKIEKMPQFLIDYMNLMKPRDREVGVPEELPEPYKNLSQDMGSAILGDIAAKKYKLYEKLFATTLENSNLFGNIYFSNYSKWLGEVSNIFFYELIPEYFKSSSVVKEMICLACTINYLREAMPFDVILTRMYLDKIYESGLDLYFEFYATKDNKIVHKLAYAQQKVIFVEWLQGTRPVVRKTPTEVINFFKNKSQIL